ncbi:MAG: WbqC family protein, partial [bacterium]
MTSRIFAAHQPIFLPNLDFFSKMAQVDQFVLADDLQYSKHCQINRCRIKGVDGAHWLTVPVRTKGRGFQKIKDVQIIDESGWRQSHWKTIHVCYKKSAYFEKYIDFFAGVYNQKWRFLIDLNMACIAFIRQALEIQTPLTKTSELDVHSTATARIVEISKKTGSTEYLCEQKYREILDEKMFAEAGIALNFYEPRQPAYHQLFSAFVPGLSIIDLLFNEGDEA